MQHEKRTENQGRLPQPTDDERDELGLGIADLTGDSAPWLIVHGNFESVRVVAIFLPFRAICATCGMQTKG
jgi:hypothetical protein